MSGIYELGEKAGWTVTQGSSGNPIIVSRNKYNYVIRKNSLVVIQTGTLDLSSGTATIETTLNEPAMLYAEIILSDSATEKLSIPLGAAVAPWKLQPSVRRPTDFDSFWEAKLKAQSEIPINPFLDPEVSSRAGVRLYTVKLNSLGSHVQGYLAKPSREGKFPALVIYQDDRVQALRPETVTDRAAEGWLAFNVDSHDNPPGEGTDVDRTYKWIGNAPREPSYFLNMYLRDARAIDYIATRPDWDGKTIVVTGIFVGGQQSLVAAALNPKISAVIANRPTGADSNGPLHGHGAGYPNWPSDDPGVMETALYFDTVNFASRVKAPVLVSIDFADSIAPPTGIWIAVNQITGPKEVVPMVGSTTSERDRAWDFRSKEVLGLILGGGEFKPL
jgi:cephalosporin-C deacetylase-like acetyl esterase